MFCDENEIQYLNSFKASTSLVPVVIDQLILDLNTLKFPQEEINEIVLSMDEAITNAVQETIETQEHFSITSKREITIRYKICKQSFDATIIDHGKGLDIQKMLEKMPNPKDKDYHQQIINYVCKNEETEDKFCVRLNGKEVTLNGVGAGLKIIICFMDQLTIDLIDKKNILSSEISDFTDGTILNMSRKRRY